MKKDNYVWLTEGEFWERMTIKTIPDNKAIKKKSERRNEKE